MFENSAKIELLFCLPLKAHFYAWIEQSIKSTFNGFLFYNTVEITSCEDTKLKQLFFSISTNSGSRNIYLTASRLGKYSATIHLDLKE